MWRQRVSFTICLTPFISVNVLSASLNKTFPFFLFSASKLCLETDSSLLLQYTRRLKRLRDACLIHPAGRVQRIISHDTYKLSYCAVPKAGCTFWINIFRFLHNETGGVKFRSPFEIPRYVTHYGERKNMVYYNMETAKDFLPYTLRFLFSRNPYSRLWSAYVDKFILPDYWISQGQQIIARRPHHVRQNEKECANDISFTEFLNQVTLNKVESLNEHWSPVSQMCDPCRFQPDIVGTMETFATDSHYILSQVNLSHLMDSTQSHVETEMAMLIKYNFHLLNSNFLKSCTNETDLALRLWKTFKINGYLPQNELLPVHIFENMTAANFRDYAVRVYRTTPSSSIEIKHRRKKALEDAYRAVPTHIMEGLKSVYATDFLMFNYNPNPSWLVSNNSNS